MSEQPHKTWWTAADQRDATPQYLAAAGREFAQELPIGPGVADEELDRRSFLKLAGFTLAAASFSAGCERRQQTRAVPYMSQPEYAAAGRAMWYATTCAGCSAGCGALVKVRDGRPIKLEGNPDHPVSQGGLCAAGQATLLGLYDSQRLTGPMSGGTSSTWAAVDRQIIDRLGTITGKGIRILTGTTSSHTQRQAIAAFCEAWPDARHISYDALSAWAILAAHEKTHGVRLLPRYRFDQASVILSFDADFLGTWISPVEFTRAWRSGRQLDGEQPRLSRHVQVESRLSLSGAKADQRIVLPPHQIAAAITQLARELAARAGVKVNLGPPGPGFILPETVDALWQNRGRSLVVCGLNDVSAQVAINLINHLLDSEVHTIDTSRPSQRRMGSDADALALVQEMEQGKVGALILAGCNPAYDLPEAKRFADAAKKLDLCISLAERMDETASVASFVCPEHHFLESWTDAEPVAGVFSVTQPAVLPLHDTRSLAASLAAWRGIAVSDDELLRDTWRQSVFPQQQAEADFQRFWDKALQDGFVLVEPPAVAARRFDLAAVQPLTAPPAPSPGQLALVLYATPAMLDGRHAHNPWLHELPDPITKMTWDNYASLAPATALSLGVADGDVVRVSISEAAAIELPAHVQPGQDPGIVAIALGYGRKGTDRFSQVGPQWLQARPTVAVGDVIGRSAAPLLRVVGDAITGSGAIVTVVPTGGRHPLACTQLHHSIDVPANLANAQQRRRPLIEQTTLGAYLADPHAGAGEGGHGQPLELYPPDHAGPGPKWGMAIDLAACTGCSACVVACQAENNVPVVGKDEVRRQREMHWMRIDRYYAGAGIDLDVAFQPIQCHHCGNAGCESVCPVLASVHSADGLNQQVYNRCVGTRYCANNCAYKVRRFNWFDYPHQDRLANMVLNPDVTVRTRGVMEKCTFCVQRIQQAKADARREGRELRDGDVVPACQQSCPAQAIVFGDVSDPNSAVSRLKAGARDYTILAELNTQPAVSFLRVVRNRPDAAGEDQKQEQQHV
jgi:molybdopterin-containing oxidoreductase family iron-sulfur binding subunit